MDLFGPTKLVSLNGKRYGYVLVDDFARLTWVYFLSHKNDIFNEFQAIFKKVKQNGKFKLSNIMSDHDGEFENTEFDEFCRAHGINHQYSSP